MIDINLAQMAQACDGILHAGRYEDRLVQKAEGVILDSRKVQPGCVFVATQGERVDGHQFIDAVFAAGALGVICEKVPVSPAGPFILVRDSFQALKDIAEAYRQLLNIPVVGITGSVGKTSTKEFIAAVLSQKYQVLKTAGNYNNEVGLPLTVLQITPEHTAAVLEMGISQFGEMHRLSKIARPDICVMTNIGQCHLESLHTRDGILKAKSEILDYMASDASICVNGDDDKLQTIQEVKGIRPVRFGMAESNDIYANAVEDKGLFGSTCQIHTPEGSFTAEIPLPGVHMVYNALAATTVGLQLGLTIEQIAAGIAAVRPVGGRSNIIRQENCTIIDDCYNANPVSMKGALELLGTALTRRVAILGDMFELGVDEVRLHSEIGAYAAQGKTDVLISVGKLAEHYDQAAGNITAQQCASEQENRDKVPMKRYYFQTRDDMEKALPDILKQGDTILVKASHGMGLTHTVELLQK